MWSTSWSSTACWFPTSHRLTQAEVSAHTSIPAEDARRFWRALGFLDVGDDDPAFTDMDLEAVRTFQGMVAMGLVDTEAAVQMARVIGTSMARIAEAEAAPGATPFVTSSGDSIIDADRFAAGASESIPAMARLLEYVWRRHLAGRHPAGHARAGAGAGRGDPAGDGGGVRRHGRLHRAQPAPR